MAQDEEDDVDTNRSLFRAANELVERLRDEAPRRLELDLRFFCECGEADCGTRLEVPAEEVRRAHEARARRLVAPGHERGARVVGSGPGFSVVADER